MNHVTRAAGTAAAGLIMLATSAGIAFANEPPVRFSVDVTGDVLQCDSTSYTVTSGLIEFAIHEGTSASGNTNITGTVAPQQVRLEDTARDDFILRGMSWFGATINGRQESSHLTFTDKLQVVAQGGGAVDSVNVTFHLTVADGEEITFKNFDFGTCALP